MATLIPLTLIGDNLGQRHKYLNSLINEAYKNHDDFDVIKSLPEKSPIDRLFKIDLASKVRNVDYIIENLKEEDMLYVSKALKSKWLIHTEYDTIINPEYLEERLYPEMITPAIKKMQHWIHLNLRDEMRCKQFFLYYQEKNVELAMKFFLKCSKEDIQNKFKNIMYKVTPYYLKVLSEKCPPVVKTFFDSISNDDEVKRLYLNKESAYFNLLRHLLKTDADMVLDISEKYFNKDVINQFSAMQTKFVIKQHGNRFWKKPELYTAWLLNIQAVADSLNSEEAKDLVLKLARAKYLTNEGWFGYQKIEPILKRLKPEQRAAFKKQVFVTKDIESLEDDWPYLTPKPPAIEIEYVTIFDDQQPEPGEYEHLKKSKVLKRIVKKKRGYHDTMIIECCGRADIGKTLLDKLFDEFRFSSFEKTLFELRKRIAAESSPKNREFMMFVLISKTGGRHDAVALLLELLERHSNEPANVRAAVIRSLVKRAQVWRLSTTSWDQLMKFGQGLGLDGKPPEADCFEGLHAVVLRNLLQKGDWEPDIKTSFLTQFSTLMDYSLNSSEKKTVAIELPKMLVNLTKEKEENMSSAVDCIEKLIQTLDAYKIKLETYPGLIDTIVMFANKDVSHIDHIIHRLFDAKIARKQLFRFTFHLKISDESYLNALRHDTTIIDAKKFAEYYGKSILCADKFFRKLSLYFSEENGLASKFLTELKVIELSKIHGRLLAFLLNNQFLSYLSELDNLTDNNSKLLVSAIRANAHLVRPPVDINVFGWKKIGAKHVGNKLSICRAIEIDKNLTELIKYKRTAKIAFALSKRTTYQTEVFVKFASIKPLSAIKSGLKLMKLQGNEVDLLIWDTMKPIIQELDMSKPSRCFLVKSLANINSVPMKIKPDYSTVIYTSLLKISLYDAMPSLCHVEILLSDVNKNFLDNFVAQFLQNYFTFDKLSVEEKNIKCTCMYIRIFVKYLLLCKNEEDQKRKYEKYCEPFLAIMEQLGKSEDKNKLFKVYFPEMLLTLKYSKVFLSTEYVSPLPVIEKIVIWMQKHFTVAEHFKTFAELHMLMLLYKATQQAIKLVPDIFIDKKKMQTKGIKVVGKILGKYIASEVNNLQKQYFESVPELYINSIVAFLDKYNQYRISSEFLSSMIEGVFEESGSAFRLGIYLMQEKRYDFNDENFQQLVNYVRKLDNMQTQWYVSVFDY